MALKIPVTETDHSQGKKNATITLVEYGDYECPYCAGAYPIIKRVQKHFDTQLRFVFRNFPLTQMHPFAEPAAETAEFANANGLFWEMHDQLYENQDRLSMPLLFELTQSLGLSSADLKNVIENHTYEEKIKSDFEGGIRSGVNGTPSFFINGQRYDGAYDFEALVLAIDQVKNKT